MNERPTPETDEQESMDNGDTAPLLDFARKLERERDEARRNAEVERLSGVAVVAVCKRQESEIEAMREAIEAAHKAIALLNHLHCDNQSETANAALAKLQPFLA